MKKESIIKMKEMMEIRGFSQNTVNSYLYYLTQFAKYFNQPPEELTFEHIHEYQYYLVHEKKVSWSTFNLSVCSIRFFLTMWSVMTGLLSISLIIKSIKNSL